MKNRTKLAVYNYKIIVKRKKIYKKLTKIVQVKKNDFAKNIKIQPMPCGTLILLQKGLKVEEEQKSSS